LMPIAFASLLGGMTTLIGTPPNIIIATFRKQNDLPPFGMFDFTPVGLIIGIAGLAFVALLGWRVLPARKTKNDRSELFDIDDYITEVVLGADSPLIGKTLGDLPTITDAEVQVLGLVRAHRRIHAPELEEEFYEGDILILETDTEALASFMKDTGAVLVGERKFRRNAKGSDKITIMEAVILPDSPLVSNTASALKMRTRYSINLLALARKEQRVHRRLDHVLFRTGDVLLLQGREHMMADAIRSMGCLPLARRDLDLGYKTKIPVAVGLFAVAILLVVFGLLEVQVAFALCALGMVLGGVLPLKEVYTSVDWPVIVLLAAMIPVGMALETSGGAATIGQTVLWTTETLPPWAVLAVILVLTMFISDIINNAATVVLMAPIAIHIAQALGHSIDPYLMAVAIGGSSAFLTPIGHQSNTLVMGPGGYKFTDYWRMGLPLEIIIVLVGVPAILYFWPL
jgi:di/tricarboxylate transporter